MMASPTQIDAHNASVNQHPQIASSVMLDSFIVCPTLAAVNSSVTLDSTHWLSIRVAPYLRMCLKARLVKAVILLVAPVWEVVSISALVALM